MHMYIRMWKVLLQNICLAVLSCYNDLAMAYELLTATLIKKNPPTIIPLALTFTHFVAVLRALISDGVDGLLPPLGLSLRSQKDREERREESARVEGASSRNRDTVPLGCTKSITCV